MRHVPYRTRATLYEDLLRAQALTARHLAALEMLVLRLMHRLRTTLALAFTAVGCDSTVTTPHEAPIAAQTPPSQGAPVAARTPAVPRHPRTQLEPLREAAAAEPEVPLDPLARAEAERNAKHHIGTVPPPVEPPVNPADLPPPPAPAPHAEPPIAHEVPPATPPVPASEAPAPAHDAPPAKLTSHELARVAPEKLCVTRGSLAKTHVAVPTFRAVAPGQGGDEASLRMRVHGTSKNERALASGQHRRQVGLKLRAANGCNLVYVMWRLDPKPKLEVSVKSNPGERTSQECGANGYTKVKGAHTAALPSLIDDQEHELRAKISGDTLIATVDGTIVWQGTLPAAAADLVGPAGVRSDNLDLDIVSFAADSRTQAVAKADCKGGGDEESD